jgi:hypothetical protein
MSAEDPNLKPRSAAKPIYRFLGGTALGTLIVLIPISAGWPIDLTPVQISIALLLAISCGAFSSLWGEKFINAVMRSLESFGGY